MKTLFKWFLRAVKGVLMFFGLTFLVLVVGLSVLVGKLSEGGSSLIHREEHRQEASIPDDGILFVDFSEPLAQRKVDERLGRLLGDAFMDAHTLTQRIHYAAKDKRMRGLVVDLRDEDLSLADRDDLLGAVKAFRDQGKKTTAYLDTFDFGAKGLVQYMTASAFDRIVMHGSGTVSLTGLAAEAPFVKTALKEHLGVEPQFFRFSENKTGANTVTEDGYTPQHRATLQAYLTSLSGIMTDRIMAARGWDRATMDSFFNKALIPAAEAKTLGLVEETSSFETFLEMSKTWVVRGGHETESPQDGAYIDVRDYGDDRPQTSDAVIAADGKADKKGVALKDDKTSPESIALIYAEGPIMDGYDPEDSPFSGSGSRVYALTLAQQIQEAVDDDVKAIVLRVDSPGGSYTASHVLRDAILSAKAQGIPVIISIKDMAASGGYFLSMDANAIVAPETSLVGSIGVFGGKFVTAGLSQKLDVKWDRVVVQPHALMWSSQTPFNPEESAIVSANLKEAYDTFGGLVKAGRKLTDEQATQTIGGQFFTGRDALALRLIDRIGGLEEAVAEAAKQARLDRRAVNVVVYPKIEDLFTGFLRFLMGGIGSSQAHVLMGASLPGMPAEGALYATMLDVYQQPAPLAVLPPVRIAGQWMGWSDR
jgi:protease-4